MADGDVYKCAFSGIFGGGNEYNVGFHYRQVGATNLPGAQALAEAMNSLHATAFRSRISSSYLLNTIEVRQVTPPATEGYDEVVALGGSLAGEVVSPIEAPVMTKRTGLVGRRYRGRAYLPAPLEAEQSAGNVLSTYITSWNTFGNGILTIAAQDGSAGSFLMVVWHDDLGTATDVTTVQVQNVTGSQVRRRLGRGS